MNDRYLFKAKRIADGEWIIGLLPEIKMGLGDDEMERLTAKGDRENYYYVKCHEECDGNPEGWECANCNHDEAACNKLGHYEDLEEQGLLNMTPDEEMVKISPEKAEEWINVFNAIWTLWNAGIFDDEEKAAYAHNVLFKIIQEFKQGLKK